MNVGLEAKGTDGGLIWARKREFLEFNLKHQSEKNTEGETTLLKGEEGKQIDFCKLGSKIIWWKKSKEEIRLGLSQENKIYSSQC